MTRNADDLIGFLGHWQKRKIVVVGDFMLDRYLYGNAQRLSPDAPVPVLAAQVQNQSPGGAANVCLDLRALHCKVSCIGIVGDDTDGRLLSSMMKKRGCDVAGMVIAKDRPTTVKHNFVGLAQHRHPQKMFRVDYESTEPVDPAIGRRLIAAVKQQLKGAAALCLEDYNKGALTEPVCRALIRAAKQAGVPVLVDPAAVDDYSRYRGATCITPNRTEAQLATGGNDPKTMARALLRTLQLQTVVLTLDKEGALLLEKGKSPVLIPTQARGVYDVTGAGDMVLAMLSAAVANDGDWQTAVALANVAAGLEVERFGVVPIDLDEILLAVLNQRHEQLGKLRQADQLTVELNAHRRQGKKIVFTNGCFDILHAGHVSYLRKARAEGDLLVVAINSDKSIGRIKGEGRPVNKIDDRLMVMSELESVDYLVVFEQDTPIKLIRAIKPDVLVKGADYKRNQVVGADVVEKHGGRIKLVPLVKGRSTTNIIGRIKGA
jgi:D-beta-D-heptose 7-phosphate kinase/D-beta-D-heptose 1-phosphate adenosyltransferase